MNDAPKILINGRVLAALLANSAPEVEIDLVKSAAAQVAEQFKRKINPEQIIEHIITLLPKYACLTSQVKDLIVREVQSVIQAIINQTIRDDIKLAAKTIIEGHAASLRYDFNVALGNDNLNQIIDRMVEKKVKETIDAYRRI